MMGTVWLRLHESQEYIQPFINAIVSNPCSSSERRSRSDVQFFGSAFMSFMAVAYVPAFLEDRATFIKERANGLYGALPIIISNFIIGLPFLCASPPLPPTSRPLKSNLPLHSPNLTPLLPRRLLALQLLLRRSRLLHMGHVALPRPPSRRIPRRLRDIHLPQLRHSACPRRLR